MNTLQETNGRSTAHSLVLGAGVSGLTSALCLARRGHRVTVLAESIAPQVTSSVAGALWEWPPAVCGHQVDPVSLARSKVWCEESYRVFGELASDRQTGVYLRPVTFYFDRPVEGDAGLRGKMHELRSRVRQFRHDARLIAENGVNPRLSLRDAYSYLAPMVDTDVYLPWLLEEFRGLGGRLERRRIAGTLAEAGVTLLRQYDAQAIVNCTGVGARELGDAAVYPVRGALVRVRNDGRRVPRVTQGHCISHDGAGEVTGFVFILPRGDSTLLLGGMAEPDAWDLDVDLQNHEPIRAAYRRCLEFLPALQGIELDAAEPVRAGLRPFRRGHVRLEAEPASRIVHNYGHGGSGVTLSWGCAREVAERVESLVGLESGPPRVAAAAPRLT